jgi:diguanylate cyclase (GGDEF)-like protein
VVLSGFGDEEDAFKSVREGAQDYLIKGQIDSNLLVRSLRYAIERKRAEETIKKLAYHDSLTGLPSRTLFNDRFTMAMAESKRNNKKMALIMLDLDHFKNINDNFGHDAGDELLKEISARLVNTLRKTDTICRMGGDEFAVLISDVSAKEMIDEVAQRIVLAVGKTFTLQGVEQKIGATLGVAIYPEDGETLDCCGLIKRTPEEESSKMKEKGCSVDRKKEETIHTRVQKASSRSGSKARIYEC